MKAGHPGAGIGVESDRDSDRFQATKLRRRSAQGLVFREQLANTLMCKFSKRLENLRVSNTTRRIIYAK